MLQYRSTFSGYSVDSIAEAERFYRDIIGVKVGSEMPGTIKLDFDTHDVFLYEKEGHKPAGYTVLNFIVDDIDDAVRALVEAGVEMEKYEGFGQDEKGISRGSGEEGPTGIAWFKDPAGNILAVIQE